METSTEKTHEKVAEYLDRGMTVLQVARLLNISPQAVYKHIERYDLELPRDRVSA